MSPTSRFSPFRPGFGGPPPYLAGRESEQGLLTDFLELLAGGEVPGTALLLYGPRGNGKTVLLGWLADEARKSFAGVDVLQMTAAGAGTVPGLAERLAPPFWRAQFRPGEARTPALAATLEWGLGEGPLPRLEEVLAARAHARPLVLILDEAHTLDPEVGHKLLNASQSSAGSLPFLLVLAGTPDLLKHLRSMNASFVGRGAQVRIGRLTDEAAGDAIRIPLEEAGVAIADDLLDSMIRRCDGYPYFTQVWGEALWGQIFDDAPDSERRRVTAADVDGARERFEATRDAYYLLRYDEIADEHLLPVARAVADAFAARDREGGREAVLTYEEVDAAIERSLGDAADPERTRAARHRLDHLGFIWRTTTRPAWEPGIPSLMDYLRRYAPSATS